MLEYRVPSRMEYSLLTLFAEPQVDGYPVESAIEVAVVLHVLSVFWLKCHEIEQRERAREGREEREREREREENDTWK